MHRIVGARMKEARILCGMSQEAAAKNLGYVNSSKLSKMENNPTAHGITLWAVIRAAKVYEVSADYLLGLTDDFEGTVGATADERGVSSWIHEALEQARRRDLDVIARLHRRISTIINVLARMTDLADESSSALRRVQELNPQWEDIRAGASLQQRIEELSDTGRHGRAKLEKLRLICRADEQSVQRLPIFDLLEKE